MAHVGKEIRRLREDREFNQAQLAVLVGTGPSAISRIESGKQNPNSSTLVKLAEALEVEIADLFPKAEASLPFEESENEALSERRKRFRDLASYAERLFAMFANLYNTRPDDPTEEDLGRFEAELNLYATVFFGFLDTLGEGGTTSELLQCLEGDHRALNEMYQLHEILSETLTEMLPLCSGWLTHQRKRYNQASELRDDHEASNPEADDLEIDNVYDLKKRREEYAKALRLEQRSA